MRERERERERKRERERGEIKFVSETVFSRTLYLKKQTLLACLWIPLLGDYIEKHMKIHTS